MTPTLVKTTRKTGAAMVECRDCDWVGNITHPFWGLSQLAYMHLTGMKHTRFQYYRWEGQDA